MKEKTYLGDGVYVELAYGQITLSADHGREPVESIVLEPEVYTALVAFVEGRLPGKPKEPK